MSIVPELMTRKSQKFRLNKAIIHPNKEIIQGSLAGLLNYSAHNLFIASVINLSCTGNKEEIWTIICLVQVRLRTEVPRTPSSTRPGFELMTSRS